MGLDGSGASRAGGEGVHNEDSFLVEQGLGLFLVCDGASESPAGEVASRIAAEALHEFVASVGEELDLRQERIARAVVHEAMCHAIDAVERDERANPDHEGLATTMTLMLAHGGLGLVGHRGDSRADLIRRRHVHQLTLDHELTQAPEEGDAQGGEFDIFSVELHSGDTIVLCTDGAEEVVQDAAIVRTAGELAPRVLASRIVSAAHRVHPNQDATTVVVRVRGDREPIWLEHSVPLEGSMFAHTIPLLDSPDPSEHRLLRRS